LSIAEGEPVLLLHETDDALSVPPGVYEVRRQREHVQLGRTLGRIEWLDDVRWRVQRALESRAGRARTGIGFEPDRSLCVKGRTGGKEM